MKQRPAATSELSPKGNGKSWAVLILRKEMTGYDLHFKNTKWLHFKRIRASQIIYSEDSLSAELKITSADFDGTTD